MVRKYLAREIERVQYGPQITQCNNSKQPWVLIEPTGKGDLVCLALEHELQNQSLFLNETFLIKSICESFRLEA